MKKAIFFLGAFILASVTLFTSCSDEENPVDYPPTIILVAGANYISDDATVTVDTTFTIKILAEANASGAKLQSLKVTRVFNLQSYDTTYSVPSGSQDIFSPEITFTAMPDEGEERIEFKIIAKDGLTAIVDLIITTESAYTPTPIRSFTMKVLGSYDSPTGSSFASIDGTVYTMAEAFANQAKVDFLYWWGGTTDATLGAPDDANANLVFTGANGLPNWTTKKNATRFKATTLTVAEFDAITDGNVLATNAAGSDQTRAGELVIDDVVAFITESGKHGLVKVTANTAGAAGDITIDVKVEE
jgi:hypothetical protein